MVLICVANLKVRENKKEGIAEDIGRSPPEAIKPYKRGPVLSVKKTETVPHPVRTKKGTRTPCHAICTQSLSAFLRFCESVAAPLAAPLRD